MKKSHCKIYRFLVDNYRRPSRKRNTAGSYLVSATSQDKALDLLKNTIGFGSIQPYGTVKPWDGTHIIGKRPSRLEILAGRLQPGDVYKIGLEHKTEDQVQTCLALPHHCCDPVAAYDPA